ncbi:S-adenosyl-L-methionine-dependent methyltransferase [Lasiosphaeris hirsuta]|uniref:S-adenosyl-L-methionine-dependent methyltransferase n=1 Tax=Lasiosphaeris hirsuta TaxID=260670 RepID=A0AA40DG50_9PEZI|nr:S-adenosyl-L-methionine-dependent methyltransferase [Lasiosphaeris hirsuta]
MSKAPQHESTFRSFTANQGADYAQNRRDYHSRLYEAVVDYHGSSGGQFDCLLDVGCGPGIAVRSLAPLFNHATAIDPSRGMIETAQALDSVPAKLGPIRFAVSTAEALGSDLSPPVHNGSVDLLVAATAAHWFDMAEFWKQAAQTVRVGGSVALWTSGSICTAARTPNHSAVQAAIDRLEEHVAEYLVPGNRLARTLYVDLALPWTLEIPVLEFDESTFVRKEWGAGDRSEPGDQFYAVQQPATLDALEKVVGTTSAVIRWREAHPSAVGTSYDVVTIMRTEIEQAFREVGVEPGNQVLEGGVSGVLLMLKRKAL